VVGSSGDGARVGRAYGAERDVGLAEQPPESVGPDARLGEAASWTDRPLAELELAVETSPPRVVPPHT
jgi:hypothetical protein